MSELSFPSTALIPLREQLPKYAAQLDKLDAAHHKWEVKRDKVLAKRLRRELGMVGILSHQTKPIDSECTIVSYEPFGRHGGSLRTEHLAWDLGAEITQQSDGELAPHLYLSEGNHRFYRGDPGMTTLHRPVLSFALLRQVIDLREQLES